MHTYESLVADGEIIELPPIESLRFNDALDVVALAQLDRCIGWKTWPEVWHLDGDGAFCCYFKGSSLDSIRAWADDPYPLRRSRSEGLRRGGCADRWVIIDSRPSGIHDQPIVGEGDVEAFLRLREALATIGVTLVDVVVFDDQLHWWSLRELTSGSTRWPTSGD